jgi:hypothetical protein
MTMESTPKNRVWYGYYEGYEARVRRRLRDDLGIDEPAADAILHLRSQVLELQSQIRQMETELSAHLAARRLRLGQYHETFYEATWLELETKE